MVGERPHAEGQGDSSDLKLPVNDLRVLTRMAETCDTVVVVLLSARSLIITDLLPNWDALVAAWLPGAEGQGVADVLFGSKPFTGKLSYTWPREVKGEPLFEFGYGLE